MWVPHYASFSVENANSNLLNFRKEAYQGRLLLSSSWMRSRRQPTKRSEALLCRYTSPEAAKADFQYASWFTEKKASGYLNRNFHFLTLETVSMVIVSPGAGLGLSKGALGTAYLTLVPANILSIWPPAQVGIGQGNDTTTFHLTSKKVIKDDQSYYRNTKSICRHSVVHGRYLGTPRVAQCGMALLPYPTVASCSMTFTRLIHTAVVPYQHDCSFGLFFGARATSFLRWN